MAKKNSGGDTSSRQWGTTDANYADVTLTDADKDAFSNWMAGVSVEFSEALSLLTDEGYRITLKVDFNNSCAQCTLTQQDNKHHNSGLIVVSRAETVEEAFWLNAYKVMELYEHQRLPTKSERALWG